jgi:hypothetical protein
MTNDLPQLDVFFGDLTVNRAYVYARLPLVDDAGEWSLAGQVRGPRCLLAETLPLSVPLVDQGSGPTLLGRALISDPVFWTADLPAIYDVTVNLLRGGDVVASARREVGLRPLGVKGRFLSLAGKRWVLRGVHASSTISTLPRHWHDAAACYVAEPPAAENSFAEASQFGSLAVAIVVGPADSIGQRLRELARYPAVALVVLDSLPADVKPRQLAPNLLLAQRVNRATEPNIQPWAHLLWVENAEPASISRLAASTELPIIVSRQLQQPLPLAAARAACDALQRDLAEVGQFAGYVV